jgi:twinkle protein
MDYDESVIIEQHISCDECGSSDAKCVYDDGHTFCYSCSHRTFNGDKEGRHMTVPPKDWNPLYGVYKGLKSRGLTEETCKKFGYQVVSHNGISVQVATYKRDGSPVGQKLRTKNKAFSWNGEKDPGLFGQSLWKAGGKKLCITEGEIDAMSLSQVQDNKWPVVSLPFGAQSATKAIKNSLEYINSFEQVVLMFDSDQPGQDAAYKCAPLIAPGKCYIAELPLKDPNEMLLAGQVKELISAMWNAQPYTPEGLINGSELFEEMNKVEPDGNPYPWSSMTKALHGIRLQEIVVLVASTGIGKSQVLKEIAYELIMQEKKIGLFFMEESNKITAQNLVGMSLNKPIHLPEHEIPLEDKKEHFDKVMGNGNVYLFNKFGSADIEDIKAKMRYLAVSCGVEYFFIDHMACFAISADAIADERKTIDTVIAVFAELVRELNVTMFLISHINRNSNVNYDEGGEPTLNSIRSSAGLAQWSSQIIGLSRNSQSEDVEERHVTKCRVLKDRFAGQVGETFYLKYTIDTGRIGSHQIEGGSPFPPLIKESDAGFADF